MEKMCIDNLSEEVDKILPGFYVQETEKGYKLGCEIYRDESLDIEIGFDQLDQLKTLFGAKKIRLHNEYSPGYHYSSWTNESSYTRTVIYIES